MIPQEYQHLLGEDLDLDRTNRIFADMTPDQQAEFLEMLQSQQAQQDEENGVGLTSGERMNKDFVDPWTKPEADDSFLTAGAKGVADTFLGSLPRFGSHLYDQIDDGLLGNADGVEAETGMDNVMDGVFSIPVIGGALKGAKAGVGLGGRSLGGAKGAGGKVLDWMGLGKGPEKSTWKSKAGRALGLSATGQSALSGIADRPSPDLDNPDGESNAKVVDPQNGETTNEGAKRAVFRDDDGNGVNDADQQGGPWGGKGPMPTGNATLRPGTGGAGAPAGNPIMDQRMAQWMGARNYLSNMNQPTVFNGISQIPNPDIPRNKLDEALGLEHPTVSRPNFLNYNGTLDQDNKSGIHHSMSHPINVKDVTRRGADNKRGTAREMRTGLQESMDIRNEIAHRNLMANRHKVTEGYEGAYRDWAKNNPNVKLDWDGSGEDRMRFVREIYPNLHMYNQKAPEPKAPAPQPNLDSPAPEEGGDGIPWWTLPLAAAGGYGASRFLGRKKGADVAKKISSTLGSKSPTKPSMNKPYSGPGGGSVSSPVSGSGGGVVQAPRQATSPSLDKIPDMRQVPGWGVKTPPAERLHNRKKMKMENPEASDFEWELPGW